MTDSTWITLISLGVTVLFMMGVPVFLVIAYWVIGCSLVLGMTFDNIGAALTYAFSNGFALLAMPLFILTGDLINKAGIARRLSDFAYAVLGWLRGGLAMAALGACGLFAAISGSNSATTATIGSMMHPEMVKGGYDTRFAAATAAAGGTVGIIIPPSIIFIVYGFLMNLPISDLFVAGIVPGVLMVVGMQIVCWLVARHNNWGHIIPLNLNHILRTAFGAWLGFFAIGLVLWGIYTGKFSPTEAAAVTVGFCVIVGVLSHWMYPLVARGVDAEGRPQTYAASLLVEGFRIRDLPEITMRSAQITGILAPLIGISVVMQQILSLLGAQAVIGEWVSGLGGYWIILGASMAIIFIAGMVLESLPVTIILAPILAPIAAENGMDPIHFAVIFLVGASIGFVTPPYGLNLYVASSVTGVPYMRLLRYALYYLGALLVVWFLVAVTPVLTTMLLPAR